MLVKRNGKLTSENYALNDTQHARLRPLLKRLDLGSVSVRDMFEQAQRGRKVRQSYTAWLEVWLNEREKEELT